MNRLFSFALIAIFAVAMTGCVPRATEQECSDMCARLVVLKAGKGAGPIDQQIASIEESHVRRIADANARKDAAIADVDKQMAEKLAAAKTDDDKKKITDEFAPLKEKASKDAETALANLEVTKTQEIAAAKEKAKASEAESAKIGEECKAECISQRTFQSIAKCRIEAQDIDAYYNRCR